MAPITRARIGFLSSRLGTGGIEKQFYYLLRDLDRSRFEPVVLIVGPAVEGGWDDAIRQRCDEVHRLEATRRLSKAISIRRFLRRFKVDVIHGLHFFLTSYGAWASLGSPARLVGDVRFFPSRENIRTDYGLGVFDWVALNAPRILRTNSEAAARVLRESVRDPARIRVVPNGCEVPREEEIEQRAARGRVELEVEPDALVVGTVARLDANKNIALMLQAAARLRAEFPRLRVRIVGDGPLFSQLGLEIDRLGLGEIARLAGRRPNAEELLPAFDILCSTSNAEGMPNVVMEAAAAGCPVVATNVGGTPEVTLDNKGGLLFERRDLEGCVRNLRRLLADGQLRQRLGRSGREHIATHYSVSAMVRGTESIYEETLRR